MSFRSFAILLALMVISPSTCHAKGPLQVLKVGNWSGGSFSNDRTGAFSHCGAYASYKSGIVFHVTVTDQYDWIIAFSNAAWRLTPSTTVPIDLTFDGIGPIRVYGNVKEPTFIVVSMPSNSQLIRSFRAARRMDAYANGYRYNFSLDTTSQLLPALAACVKENLNPQTARGNTAPLSEGASSAATNGAPPNKEAAAERDKLLSEAAAEHGACLRNEMRQIVPYSNEGAETLSQVFITKCADAEQKFIRLGMAIFGISRAEIEKIVGQALEGQKKKMIADIVTFRSELAKALLVEPKHDGKSKKGDGI